MQRIRAYFISDAHLISRSHGGDPLQEQHLVDFLGQIAPEATHLFLLGDIIDYWYEYRDVVPKGFTRFFGALARMADSGVKITWIAGNHDIWLFGYFREELGIDIHDGSMTFRLGNKNFFLNHGDTVGERPKGFRFIQAFFRNRLCQRLFSAIHPRWTVAFANAWSRRSRASHLCEKAASVESNALTDFSRSYLTRHPDTDFFIFGHLHVFGRTKIIPMATPDTPHPVAHPAEAIFLGEWMKRRSYALFDGNSLSLHTFQD